MTVPEDEKTIQQGGKTTDTAAEGFVAEPSKKTAEDHEIISPLSEVPSKNSEPSKKNVKDRQLEFNCIDRESLSKYQDDELIFLENPGRWVLLPVEFPTIFQFYKALENQYWTPGPFIWDKETLLNQISGEESAAAAKAAPAASAPRAGAPSTSGGSKIVGSAASRSLCVYCVLVDLKLFKGILACEEIDSELYMDVLDQLCGITDYIQSPEARAFIGFQNMLEEFHREAINGALSSLTQSDDDSKNPELVDPTGTVSSSICIPHIRHTFSKALWIKNHLNTLTRDNHPLPGDTTAAVGAATPAPCLPEALITLVISRGLFNTCCIKMIKKWIKNEDENSSGGGGSKQSLNKFLKNFLKDMFLFSDFYAHIYANLKMKLSTAAFFQMISEALILEYQYLCTIAEPTDAATTGATTGAATGAANGAKPSGATEAWKTEIGSIVKGTVLRVVSGCGESCSEFEVFYKMNEQNILQLVRSICWDHIENMRNTKYDNSSLPYFMFEKVPGDWISSSQQTPIISFDTNELGFHVDANNCENNKMEQIPSNTTAPLASETMKYDDDF